MKKRIIVSLSLVAVALALVGGIFLVRALQSVSLFGGFAERSDLVGSWSGPDGAQVDLLKDGSATVTKVPTHFSWTDESPLDPLTADGTWTLEKKASKLVDQEVAIALNTGVESVTKLQVRIMDERAQGGIYLPISEDSPKRFVFERDS